MSADSSSVPSVHPALDLAAPLAYLILGASSSGHSSAAVAVSPLIAAAEKSWVGDDPAATSGELMAYVTTPNWSKRDAVMHKLL